MKNDWKVSLIGEIRKEAYEAEFQKIMNEELKKPFSTDESVCRCVCLQCHNIFEITEEVVIGFLKTMDILGQLPDISVEKIRDLKNFYFEIGYCNLCPRRDELHIQLKSF